MQAGIQRLGELLPAMQITDPASIKSLVASVLNQLVGVLDHSRTLEEQTGKLQDNQAVIIERIKNDKKELVDKLNYLHGQVDVWTAMGQGTEQGSRTPPRRFGILESKAVSNLETLSSDKGKFKKWNERFINAITQVRPGTRELFRAMAEYVDGDKSGEFRDHFEDNGLDTMQEEGTKYEHMESDLYAVLVDKTDGEAALRIRACKPGEGTRAYMLIYKWFTGASGQAMTERVRKLMSPGTPKSEDLIADSLDKWIEAARNLEAIKEEYRLADPFKLAALEQMMNIGQAKLHFEHLAAQGLDFDDFLQKCKDYALRRRLESDKIKSTNDPMDIGAINGDQYDWWRMGGGYEDNDYYEVDLDTVKGKGKKGGKGYQKGASFKGGGKYGPKGKGVAKGKGKSEKGKGKGGSKGKGKGFQGHCYNCGQFGHSAAECTDEHPFQGACSTCGWWGHSAKNCSLQGPLHEIEEHEREDQHDTEVNWIGGLAQGLVFGGGVDLVEEEFEHVHKSKKTNAYIWALDNIGKGDDRKEAMYEVIKVTADSGAVDHVAPESFAKSTPLKATRASSSGMYYTAANGTKIKNKGEKHIKGFTREQTPIDMTWQVADVKKPLASIGKICDNDNVAIFTKNGGVIVPSWVAKEPLANISKERDLPRMSLERKGGIYTFDIKVPREKNIQTGNRFSALAEEDNGQEEHIVEECGEEAWMHAGRPGFSRQGVW